MPFDGKLPSMEKAEGNAKLRVLVVEDATEVAARLADLLAELDGVEVIGPVLNGTDAIRQFHAREPHAVVLDLQLPGRSGFEVLAAIRQSGRPCVVLVLTSHDSIEFRDRCRQAGADYFLRKSSEFERVQAIVRDLAARG
ncbi:MAG TPA: response regulator transcription factor [Opitutus sp.]|nr:response regulator transcription factor [Opitutus sp.]